MTYQIVKVIPEHDDRDCIRAWRFQPLPNAYETIACARAIAARLDDGIDESSYRVVRYDESAATKAAPWPPVATTDLPF